jgi:hypothetical protein
MPLVDFLSFGVEGHWRLMWFPIRSAAELKQVRVRANAFRLLRSEVPPPDEGIHGQVFELGQGSDPGDRLSPSEHPVLAWLAFKRRASGELVAEIELRLGGETERTDVTIEPDRRTPFMLSAHASPRAVGVADTAAVVDGVFNAGHRYSAGDFLKVFGR